MNHYKDSFYVPGGSKILLTSRCSLPNLKNYSEPWSYLKRVQLETHQPSNGSMGTFIQISLSHASIAPGDKGPRNRRLGRTSSLCQRQWVYTNQGPFWLDNFISFGKGNVRVAVVRHVIRDLIQFIRAMTPTETRVKSNDTRVTLYGAEELYAVWSILAWCAGSRKQSETYSESSYVTTWH
jgi:hypothetical protein